jgi:hypothetical protein
MSTQRFFPGMALILAATVGIGSVHAAPETSVTRLFDGKTLNGWHFVGAPGHEYKVRDGNIVCEEGVSGNLFTDREYENFVFRFEFKPDYGANNGVGIRAPFEGDAAYVGMEIQILEESGAVAGKWGKLRPSQFHGSVYGVLAAKLGAMKKPGEWNQEEIRAEGRRIKVTLNGVVILDGDLNSVTDEHLLQDHPGLLREKGHIGFLGHNDHLEFRNITIQELPSSHSSRPNTPPAGFASLFNGRDLTGWQGLLASPMDNPFKRDALPASQRATEQAKADERMRQNWKVENGTLVYRGNGFDNLVTTRQYSNFELFCDFKLEPTADSGIYLRSVPQVQIWEPNTPGNPKHETSGGLFNNRKPPTGPLKAADKPVGQWNQFHIVMAGDHVHVFVNGELVVENVALDNYWDKSLPIPAIGPIELQAHKSSVYFQNLYFRELK